VRSTRYSLTSDDGACARARAPNLIGMDACVPGLPPPRPRALPAPVAPGESYARWAVRARGGRARQQQKPATTRPSRAHNATHPPDQFASPDHTPARAQADGLDRSIDRHRLNSRAVAVHARAAAPSRRRRGPRCPQRRARTPRATGLADARRESERKFVVQPGAGEVFVTW
jgi:hypothetical protein